MAIPRYDPYGETDIKGWQDPFVHKLLKGCPGCADVCADWTGKTYDQIRAQRVNLVVRLRNCERPEPTAREFALEDRYYWDA